MEKLTDLINKSDHLSFSFEVTPDLPVGELDNLGIGPLFYSVTWHAKVHQNKDLDIAPLRLAKYLRSKDKNVVLHLSCDLLRKDFLKQILAVLQENRICNLFIILGERFDEASSDFKTTVDLIKTIRQETGSHFCIGVAASPDCNDEKLQQLKQKVDSGANYVFTQAFFEPNLYPMFRLRCQAAGINVPVIPGVFPFETHQQLMGFINTCKIKVSEDILQFVKDMDQIKGTPGRELTQTLIKSIAADSNIKHFHLFTINKLANSVYIVKSIMSS